jgi:hypothetical protein
MARTARRPLASGVVLDPPGRMLEMAVALPGFYSFQIEIHQLYECLKMLQRLKKKKLRTRNIPRAHLLPGDAMG